MADWTDFLKAPAKAAKQLHVSKSDVARGEVLNAHDKRIAAWPKTDEPYGQTLKNPIEEIENPYPRIRAQIRDKMISDARRKYGEAAPKVTGELSSSLSVLKHAFMRDEEAKNIAKGLALTAGIAGSVAAPALVPAAPTLSAAAINAITGALPNLAFGNPEGIGQDAIAGALLGKLSAAGHPGLGALSMLGSYTATDIPEAEAASKFDSLHRMMRMMSQQNYGRTPTEAQRGSLEFLRDNAPATFEVLRPDNLTKLLLRNSSDSKERMAIATPQQFKDLSFARPRSPENDAQVDVLEKMLRERVSLPDAWNGTYYVENQPKFRGFGDTPMLQLMDQDELPFARIRGHEGRHRMEAAGRIYGENTPMAIRALGYDADELDNVLNLPFAMSEKYSKMPAFYEDPRLFLRRNLRPFAGGGAVKRLGKAAMSQFDELRGSSVAPLGALSVVKNKGGNWLSGSVEDALRGLKERKGGAGGEIMDTPINSWIDSQLTKYVKNRMATPDDEVRKLAEQGVLHFEPRRMGYSEMNSVARTRERAGMQALAKSHLAKDWERISDAQVGQGTFRMLDQTPINFNMPDAAEKQAAALRKLGGDYAVANPDATAYKLAAPRTVNTDLGFPHLIDELSNALNPNSGLPRNLQLSPEAVANLSMEKAVRRVADINAWRAAQKVEASRKLAEQAALVREYTENNPKGLRWVELKKGKDTGRLQELILDDPRFQIPEEQQIRFMEQAHMEAARKGIEDESDDLMEYVEGRTRELSEDWARKNPAFEDEAAKALRDQLKYEGDTMGHCVGGYCDDVLSGRSRIFSLRDAKGEPHVTVEVRPPSEKLPNPPDDVYAMASKQAEEAQKSFANSAYAPSWGELVYDSPAYREWLAGYKPPPSIAQIKGKQNRAPNPEYLPFVQDFVRNSPLGGSWGEVGDLHNTGLRRTIDAFNSLELRKIQEAGIEVPQWASQEDINAIGKKVWPDRYAHGGSVQKSNPTSDFQAMIAALEQELAHAAG